MSDEKTKDLEWTGERYVPQVPGNIRLEHLHRYLIAREFSHNRRVLDIACGEGYGSDLLATVASEVVGVDIAKDAIAHASARYVRPNLLFKQGACEAIPLPDRSVDVVVSFETIEHVRLPQDMLREIRRVLCTDGLLVISTPDRDVYSDVLGNKNTYHVSELNRAEFEQVLRSYFLNIIIGGQRVRGGSIVGPLAQSTDTIFASFPFARESYEGVDRIQGIEAPTYLVALASDQPLPALPVGLLDGGDLVWASDWQAVLLQAQTRSKEFERHIEHLSAELTELTASHEQLLNLQPQLSVQLEVSRAHITQLQEQVSQLQAQVETYERSRSWRLTAPLRAVRRRGRAAPPAPPPLPPGDS